MCKDGLNGVHLADVQYLVVGLFVLPADAHYSFQRSYVKRVEFLVLSETVWGLSCCSPTRALIGEKVVPLPWPFVCLFLSQERCLKR